jgi:putative peptidoglycan lipid II flippase
LGINPQWGVVGLTASAGVAGWLEFVLLRRSLNAKIGRTGLPFSFITKLWLGATVGAAVGWGFRVLLGRTHPIPLAVVVLGGYGVTYFAVTSALGIGEARRVISRALRVLRISR